MEDQRKHIIWNFAIIFALFAIGFAAVVIKVVITQTSDREALLKVASLQVSRNEIIRPNRGNIFDCNGNLLAGSAPTYYIRMDTRVAALHAKDGELFRANLDSVSYALSAYFKDRTPEGYKRLISSAYQRGEGRLLLYPKRITYLQLKAVRQMPLFRMSSYKSGLIVDEGYQRIKPQGRLASRTIGEIYGGNGRGRSGLEKGFEKELCGIEGHKQTELIDGRVVISADQEAIDGHDIVTTLDAKLQDIVETQLLQTVQACDAEWGCCILMEVQTGEVKAIANLGRVGDEYLENQNYAVSRVEPGSTFKTFALMAALEKGKFTLTDTLNVEGGQWVYSDPKRPIVDAHKYNTLTVKQVLAASSNVGMAKIVTSSYEKKATNFVDKLDKMGVRDSFIFEIPGTDQPLIQVPKDRETLARMSFGYSVELPPMAILMFYNAIANDGKMIRPYLVKSIRSNDATLQRFSTSTVRSSICSSSTLKDIRESLESVVWDNTYGTASVTPWGAKKAQSDLVHIAGKTGTARILENGHYLSNQHRITFCGYFPMEDPVYTCLCMVQRPKGAYDAGFTCGGTVRRIAEKTMAHTGYISVKTRYTNPDSLALPSIKRGKQTAIRKAAKGTNTPVSLKSDEWVRINEHYESEPLLFTDNLVPNVVGMGAKDAVYLIERTGMHAVVKGKGKVISQSLQPGIAVTKGGTMYIQLQ